MVDIESSGMPEKNVICGGTLYLVATPIGNLSDISERAKKVLSEVDFIAAEDTRNSLKLLNCLGIKSKPMISYFEHNKRARGEVIAEKLAQGQSCALVTDAGTPAISDPGADIAALCVERGINVTSVPGPCAAIDALILSGFDTTKFVFEGFISGTKSERAARLSELAGERRTLVLYEAPHRIKDTISEIYEAFGERRIALCRELTKLNEDISRTTLLSALEYFKNNEPRGEYVIVIEGAPEKKEGAFWSEMNVREHVEFYISQGQSKMDAMKSAARDRGVGKSDIYKEMI